MLRFAPIVLVSVLVAACGSGGGSSASRPDLPSGDTVVASHETGGGFVAFGFDQTSLPQVVVYGNGDALAGTDDGRIFRLTLDQAELEGLIADLIGTGLGELPEQVEPGGQVGIADAATTTLAVWAKGGLHRVSAYALDFQELEYPAGLRTADRILTELGHRVVSEGQERPPDRVRLVAAYVAQGDALVAWPESIPMPDAFKGLTEASPFPITAAIDDQAQLDAVIELFGGQRGLDIEFPDGSALNVLWRPLLPHE